MLWMKSGIERRRQAMERAMIKTLVLSILLSVVLVTAWFVDMIRYHEPQGLEPFRGDVFETVSFQVVGRPQSTIAN